MHDCETCGVIDDVEGQCPTSPMPCEHHCNHVFTDAHCHYCNEEECPDD